MGNVVYLPSPRGFEPWVTKKQLARYLGFSTRWIELRHHQGLPSRLVDGRRRYRISEVEVWLAGRAG